jgi:hypothetical protein
LIDSLSFSRQTDTEDTNINAVTDDDCNMIVARILIMMASMGFMSLPKRDAVMMDDCCKDPDHDSSNGVHVIAQEGPDAVMMVELKMKPKLRNLHFACVPSSSTRKSESTCLLL